MNKNNNNNLNYNNNNTHPNNVTTRRRLKVIQTHLVVASSSTSAPEQEKKAEDPFDLLQPSTYMHVPRFEPGDPAASKYLETEGYVVFKNCLTKSECEKGIQYAWDWLEEYNPNLNRNNIETWKNENWYNKGSAGNGIIGGHGIGQSKLLWHCRSVPRVKEAFANILGDDNLLTSFDGANVFRPWKYDASWKTKQSWFHTDQLAFPIKDKDGKMLYHGAVGGKREYIQGFVNLVKTTPETGGNTVVPKTHKMFMELAKKYGKGKYGERGMYYIIARKEPELLNTAIRAHLEAGDLFLWDSRTIHGNSCGFDDSGKIDSNTNKNHDLIRVIAYVCMAPKAKLNEKDRDKYIEIRKKAVENGWTDGHQVLHTLNFMDTVGNHRNKFAKKTGIILNEYQKELAF